MTNWLAVDTSMNACGVGIKRADGEFFSDIRAMERGQAEALMPMIVDLAKAAGISLTDIDAYAVTNGPGTFTGLRVGLATVRALSQASGKPAFASAPSMRFRTPRAKGRNASSSKPSGPIITCARPDMTISA